MLLKNALFQVVKHSNQESSNDLCTNENEEDEVENGEKKNLNEKECTLNNEDDKENEINEDSDVDEEKDDDSEDGWITSSNILEMQKKMGAMVLDSESTVCVACISTDFSVQV